MIKTFDIEKIKKDFPALKQKVNGKPLVYLDSAATALKPQTVVDRLNQYYTHETANIHRGAHYLSDQGTKNYEKAREKVKVFLNAQSTEEIIFTKGTTESINLVAHSWGHSCLKKGDEILLSQMEHHANIVPWQILAEQTGAKIRVIDIDEKGHLDKESFEKLLCEKTKILAITHCSNVLGTINDIKFFTKKAKLVGAKVLVDGAQAVCCQKVDVQELGVDFYAFSAHKLWGPYGVGVLYAQKSILESMVPYQSGGGMIGEVDFSGTTFNSLPHKFEAGTPHVPGVIGLGEAIDYIETLGMEAICYHGKKLLEKTTEQLGSIDGLKIIGQADHKSSLVSFIVKGVHPNDIGTLLDEQGIAIRTGHHCAQPLMKRFEIPGTIRASFSIYNDDFDIDKLVEGVKKSMELLK